MKQVDKAERLFVSVLVSEVQTLLKTYKDNWSVTCGMGIMFIDKNNKTIYSYEFDSKLPKKLYTLIDIWMNNDFIDGYVSIITASETDFKK